MPRLLRVGLTGGIATGKSHVLQRLAGAGFATVDLDRVAHEVMAPGTPGHRRVVEAFGPSILGAGGEIDRRRLGAVVFSSPEARRRLDELVHPLVREREAETARAAEARGETVLVTDAALLVEAGLHLRFDRLVVTYCPPEVQRRRLRDRDGLDERAAQARLEAQMPAGEKRAFAHAVIDTSGDVAATDRAVDTLAGELRQLSATPASAAPARGRALGCLVRGPARGPRGLSPQRLLAEIAAAGGLDLARTARLLEPFTEGPWYRAARAGEGAPGPESLAGPLVVWALAASRGDAPFVLGAAWSLGRLTHLEPGPLAGACLAALCLRAAALQDVPRPLGPDTVRDLAAQARARAGAEPPPAVAAEIEAGGAAAPAGGLAGALRGMAEGPAGEDAPPGLAQSIDAVLRLAG